MRILTTLIALALAAPARSRNDNRPVWPCLADGQKFCPAATAKGDTPAVAACMRAHLNELSTQCRDFIVPRLNGDSPSATTFTQPGPAAGTAPSTAPKPSAAGDSGKPPEQAPTEALPESRRVYDGGETATAPAAAEPAKKTSTVSAKSGNRDLASACANERGLFCHGVQTKNGALLRCLFQHKDDASSDCRTALASVKTAAERRKETAK